MTLKGQIQGHSYFERLSRKIAMLGPMLLHVLNINRKPYMGSSMAPSHLNLSNLESQTQGPWNFEALHLVNEPR